jgi:hypothetical protein
MCKEIYKDDSRVNLHFGDSREVLQKVLENINERCTFWLDAHYCGGESVGIYKGVPIMEELAAIAKHPIKNHTILIDDMRLLRDKPDVWKPFTLCICDIEEFIHVINPDYVITFGYGEVDNDILIAQVL